MKVWWIPFAAYLLGSIPFALLLAGVKGVDVRTAGSGNVGAANVWRTTNRTMGVTVALLDILKGCTAVWIGAVSGADTVTLAVAALAAVIGHVYPIWLRFRGGKGVAVAAGAFGVLTPGATTVALVLFILVIGLTRYVSLGSVLAALALPLFIDAAGNPNAVVWSAYAVAAVVVLRHRANLRRLLARTERRLGEPA